MRYDWDFRVMADSLPFLLRGLQLSVALAAITMLIGSAIGLVVVLVRLKGRQPLTWLAIAYTEFFRTTPFLAQVLWVYYAVPIITGIRMSPFQAAVLSFSLNVGAFMAEIFRAGILSVGKGQMEAGLSLGLTPGQAMRRIVLPQALRNILPPTASIWLSLFKDTSVASVIAVGEMMYQARALAVNTYRPVEILSVAALIYFVVVYPQSIAIDWIHEILRGEPRRRGRLAKVTVQPGVSATGAGKS